MNGTSLPSTVSTTPRSNQSGLSDSTVVMVTLRHGGGLAVVGALARDVDAQGAVLGEALEPRHPLGREFGGVGAPQDRRPRAATQPSSSSTRASRSSSSSGSSAATGDGCLDRARTAVGVLPAPREAQHVAGSNRASSTSAAGGAGGGGSCRRGSPPRSSERGMEVRAQELGHICSGHVHGARLRERGPLGGRERRRERGELDRARVEVEA
jgi:hypothetical protein